MGVNGHVVIVLILLLWVSIYDIRERRIPNMALISATVLHIVLELLFNAGLQMADIYPLTFALAFLSLVLLNDRARGICVGHIGMGDIKLLLYLITFLLPFIDPLKWVAALTIVSILGMVILLRGRSIRRALGVTLPLAPYLLGATAVAAIL